MGKQIIPQVEDTERVAEQTPRQLGVLRSACSDGFLSARADLPRDGHKRYFDSESSVYRILKAADLITKPVHTPTPASDSFKTPTRQLHGMW